MTPSADEVARSMGFKNAAQMTAWQARQGMIQHATDEVMSRSKPVATPQPHPQVQRFLDSIMEYLPLGVLQKAGNAMDGKH